MGLRYLETSALVKLYIAEVGTPAMLHMASPLASHELAVLALSQVECVSAIRRRLREGDLQQSAAESVEQQLDRHMALRFLVQPLTDRVLDEAVTLLRRHPLRAFDALQLAGFLVLVSISKPDPADPPVFVSADERLLAAARTEAVEVQNPSDGAYD
jgi:predicted nucleic acid-binding protein